MRNRVGVTSLLPSASPHVRLPPCGAVIVIRAEKRTKSGGLPLTTGFNGYGTLQAVVVTPHDMGRGFGDDADLTINMINAAAACVELTHMHTDDRLEDSRLGHPFLATHVQRDRQPLRAPRLALPAVGPPLCPAACLAEFLLHKTPPLPWRLVPASLPRVLHSPALGACHARLPAPLPRGIAATAATHLQGRSAASRQWCRRAPFPHVACPQHPPHMQWTCRHPCTPHTPHGCDTDRSGSRHVVSVGSWTVNHAEDLSMLAARFVKPEARLASHHAAHPLRSCPSHPRPTLPCLALPCPAPTRPCRGLWSVVCSVWRVV